MDNSTLQNIVSGVIGLLAGVAGSAIWLARYAQKIDHLIERVKDLEKDNREHSIKITQCETRIEERTSGPNAGLFKRKSPISLTAKGEDVLKKSGADKFVIENLNELIQKIKEKNPMTAYDVQEYSYHVIQSLTNDWRINHLKDFAFKEGMDLEAIFRVTALFLRDRALPILNFAYEQIDETDPSIKTKNIKQ